MKDLDYYEDKIIQRDLRLGWFGYKPKSSLNTFKVYFDGGDCRERAYGSWQIEYLGFKKRVSRFRIEPLGEWCFPRFDHLRATSNIAEYVSLIRALEWLGSVKDKELYRVEIWGDSKLVVSQLNGSWRVRKEYLRPFRDRIWELLKGFGSWEAHWHPRIRSVGIFGH